MKSRRTINATNVKKHFASDHINKPASQRICPHCYVTLENSTQLANHLQISCLKLQLSYPKAVEATPIEPECQECHKKFEKVEHLVAHEKLHEEMKNLEKNYQCDNCEKSYASEYALRKHTYEFHDEMVCRFCNVRFAQIDNLMLHIRRKHETVKNLQNNILEDELKNRQNTRAH